MIKFELHNRTKVTVITYFRMTRDQEICRYLPQSIQSEAEALAHFEKAQQPGATSYGRTIYADGHYIGDIWCYNIQQEEPNAMISYCIFDKAYWGKGIAAKSLQLFLDEIIEKFCFTSIGAFTYSANIASVHVLLKNGFQEVETFMEDGVESKYFQIQKILNPDTRRTGNLY